MVSERGSFSNNLTVGRQISECRDGRWKKQAAKQSKEVPSIEIALDPITLDEEKQFGQFPLFNESNFVFWKAKMEAYLQAQEYEAWHSIFSGDTSIDKSRRYNTKVVNVTINTLPDTLCDTPT